jgi:seryl-tRNA synthetase
MLDFRKVGADLEHFQVQLARRPGFDAALINRVQDLWQARASVIQETQQAQQRRNELNKDMKRVMREGSDEEKSTARTEAKAVSERVKALEAQTKEVEGQLEALMLEIPNVPHPSVPEGAGEEENVEVRRWGRAPTFDFEPLDHMSIGVDHLGLLDFEAAARLTGSRFVVQFGPLARLERALTALFIDTHVSEHGYTEVAVPYLVNRESLTGTGQLPKFEGDLFKVPFSDDRDYFLIPTAEVPVTNLYRDTILTPDDGPLPHAFACYTACFRSEAGAAGKDTRGMIRQHQFNKVEMVRFVEPETSYDELEVLVRHAEAVLEKLGLHYRTVLLCTGDLSANAAKCFDVEVWLPGQGRFREIFSCSNFEDFQARRARIRYKTEKKGKAKLLHTLNGSGLAVGRTLIAILENYQDADGGVRIPDALRPYMGGVERIEPRDPRR